VLVKHARNVLGMADAAHAESMTDGDLIITPLSCSLDGRTIDVDLVGGTLLSSLHGGVKTVTEFTTCNYGLDPARRDIASSGGMRTSGVDGSGEPRAVERDDHPFFVATLYQPQLRSSPSAPHPVWSGFLSSSR